MHYVHIGYFLSYFSCSQDAEFNFLYDFYIAIWSHPVCFLVTFFGSDYIISFLSGPYIISYVFCNTSFSGL